MPGLAVNQKGVQVPPRRERDLKRPNPSGPDHGPRCPSREVGHDGDILGCRMLVSKVYKYFFRFFRDRLPQLRAPACGHDKAKNREQHHRVTTGKQRAPCRGFSDCVHNDSFLSQGRYHTNLRQHNKTHHTVNSPEMKRSARGGIWKHSWQDPKSVMNADKLCTPKMKPPSGKGVSLG